MEKCFVVSTPQKNIFLNSAKTILDLPRVNTKANRLSYNKWEITLAGSQSDVELFILKLETKGLKLYFISC